MSLIYAATTLLAAATILPWLPWSHGLIRSCDFPRVQIASLAAFLIPLNFLLDASGGLSSGLFIAQLGIIFIQAFYCWRFTRLHRVEALPAAGGTSDNSVRILSANVKLSNCRFDALIGLVKDFDPDILIAMEVDESWSRSLQPLEEKLPYAVKWPCDNSYGMILLSKLELVEPEIRFLVFDKVPSIRTAIRLRNGELFRLYAVHPEPPVPLVDTIGRDGELIKIAREVQADSLPSIVAGDLNDVAWSRTTARFQRLSRLLDPRVGRGFFNTFDARFPFLRWPLDHVFHDARFRVVNIARLPDIGSDHFPLMFELSLRLVAKSLESPPPPDHQDRQEAETLTREAKHLDREPVGVDWEDKR
jgi:endonuclease/exonuclease/phosphatase (EEP) superfamily protein YafD